MKFMQRMLAPALATLAVLLAWPCFGGQQPSAVLCQVWNVPAGDGLEQLLSGKTLDQPPTTSGPCAGLEYSAAAARPGCVVLRAVLTPPADGDYLFYIAAGEEAALYFGPADQPEKRVRIADVPVATPPRDWQRYAAQTSAPQSLGKNRKYLLEAIVGGKQPAHLEVGWRLPDGTMERPIKLQYLSSPPENIKPIHLPPTSWQVLLKGKTPPATTGGHHGYPLGAAAENSTGQFDFSYQLWLPMDWPADQRSRALFVFLHGNGHQGTDLSGILNEGPPRYLAERPELAQWFPMVALFPQLPPKWRWDTPGAASLVNGLIEQICRRYPRIDRKRIYLSGLSMGGKGVWLTALQKPNLYAAIAPISAVSVQPETAKAKLTHPWVWIICGGQDGDFRNGARLMYQTLGSQNGRVRFDEIPDAGHGVWDRFYPTRDFYAQLLRHTR